MEAPHGWNHAICYSCWNKRKPGETPNRMIPSDLEPCCFCEGLTTAGIYVREDPKSPALMCRPKATPAGVSCQPEEDSIPDMIAGALAVEEVLSDFSSEPDPAPEPATDPPADTFGGFGGGDTGGGGAGGDW
jgi:hypothetical protein